MLALPLVALFLFIIVFAAMFVATMRKRATAYDPLARMPLEDEPINDDHEHDEKGASR